MIERYTPALILKDAKTASDGVFSGYASTFNGPVDSYGDVIAAGAFLKSLDQHGANQTAPAMLWAHNIKEPIGRWLEITEDRHGLKVTGRFTLATQRGQEAHALAKDGALGMSIGYRLVDAAYEGKIQLIKEVDLVEISLVSVPANHAARITEVKSAPTNIRDFERLLRDEIGYSRADARRLATRGWSDAPRSNDQLINELDVAIKSLTDFSFKG
ncbi:HK97 family phage prohead protease [Collimonas humicola]|uniref:HK97 family phage prohead protease n=1 Tax=Collimonas humicola TaxID=2825886 RepID=UPI001B8D24DF|nr:HK97 family phage prohead protease [Collimonas humicola]